MQVSEHAAEERRLPLSGIRVIDLSRVVAGPFGTQLLCDLGAQVLRVHPPGAGPTGNEAMTEPVVFDWALNRGKASIELDLRSEPGRERMLALLESTDVLWDNFRPGVMARLGLDGDALREHLPHLVTCSLSGFGATGAWATLPAYDVVVQAAGGAMHTTGAEHPAEPPVRWGLPIGDLAGGMYGAIGVLGALAERQRSGLGQSVDVSLFDAQLALAGYRIPQVLDAGVDVVADQRRGGAGTTPYGPFRCADGRWLVVGVAQPHWKRTCEVVGRPDLAHHPRFATEADRRIHQDEICAEFERLLTTKSAESWETALLAAGVPCGRVNTPAEAFAHPQAMARGMVTTIGDGARSCRVATDPLSMGRSRLEPPRGVDAQFAWADDGWTAPTPTGNDDAAPLTGVRVVELDGEEPSKAVATQLLADLGAEVVVVERPTPVRDFATGSERPTEPEALRWGLHRGKSGRTLDLKSPGGLAELRTLIAQSDIVIDNYRPGVLSRLGVDPEAVVAGQPGLLWISVTGFGHSGPWSAHPAYDVTLQALGGAMSITGNEPGGMPIRWGHPVGGLAGALFAAVGALAHRIGLAADPAGRRVDLALLHCQIALQSYRVPQALDLGFEFVPQPREGGSGARPYGPFRTRDDRWFAVAITSQFWKGFCTAVDRAELLDDPRFATEPDRRLHPVELDAVVTEAFATRTAAEWQEIWLDARLPGAEVRSLRDACELSEQLSPGMVQSIPRPAGGVVHVAGFAPQLSRSRTGRWTPPPERGEA